ncbi:MAG TPA: flagellar protein FlgN [Candidatus Ozemobacteraceae bacterium]|nr:flagellar protein FlgN [Candidatus Ozemobacteraceae bacterium]
MSDQGQNLKQILGEELEIYRRLLDLSERKKKLLLEKFSTDLLQIVTEEEKCSARLGELSTTRADCLTALTGRSTLKLEEALDFINDANLKSDLWMLGTQLREILDQIRTINEDNRQLLEQALELTQYSLKLLTAPPKDVTYRPPGLSGKTGPQGPSVLIDRKA